MRKKKLIEQKLNQLAQSIRLKTDTVRDAVYELSRAENSPKPRRRTIMSVATACAVIIIVIASIFIVRSLNNTPNDTPPASYKLDSLQSTYASEINVTAVPFSTLGNAWFQQKLFTLNGETKVVSTKIINVAEHGTDQIIVYQDLGNGLADFDSYLNYSQRSTDNKFYTIKTTYKNGEHYSYCYYKDSEIDYYIVIMSPYSDAATFYFQKK